MTSVTQQYLHTSDHLVPTRHDRPEAQTASRRDRAWLVLQGLIYLPSGIALMIQSLSTVDPDKAHDLNAQLVERPALRILMAATGAAILIIGILMTARGFSRRRQRALPGAPARLRAHIGWFSGIGAVGRGVSFVVGGALLLAEARTNSAQEASQVSRAMRAFWQQPYGRPLLFSIGLALVMFGIYELLAARYRPAPEARLIAGTVSVPHPEPAGTISHAGGPDLARIAILVAAPIAIWGLMSGVGMLLVHGATGSFVSEWDNGVSQWFYEQRTATLDRLTHYGSVLSVTRTCVLVTILAVVLLRLSLGRWREAAVVVAAIAGEVLIFVAITATVHRARPDVPHLDAAPPTSSFPSGHTGAAIALYGCLALILFRHVRPRWLASAFLALGFTVPVVVAISRIYRGMHHVTDVMGSLVVGGVWLTLVVILLLPARHAAEDSGHARDEHPATLS